MAKTLPGGPEAVEVYETVAARAAALPTPRVGQCAITLDDGALSIYYGAYLGWRPSWATPWGEVAFAEITSPVAVAPAITWGAQKNTPVAGLSLPWTPVFNRRYEFVFDGCFDSNANGDLIDARINAWEPDRTDWHQAGQTVDISMTGIAPTPSRFVFRTGDAVHRSLNPPRAGLWTVEFAAGQVTGSSGRVYADGNYQSSLRIVDIGPLGDPLIS